MITYKVTTQEYSISYKDMCEIGREEIGFEEYESKRELAINFLTGMSNEEEAKKELTSDEFEELEGGIESLLEDLHNVGGIWYNNDYEYEYDYSYYGKPEPVDGYNCTGRYYTYKKIKKEKVYEERMEYLASLKEELLNEITHITCRVDSIDSQIKKMIEEQE
jgi:hypothetical protein